MFKIGYGYDIHPLKEGRKLVLGGVEVPFERGLDGHSDADVLLHAITDAMLGAVAAGDIGVHFPDSDPSYKEEDSTKFLDKAVSIIHDKGYRVGNIDCTVVAQRPKLQPYIDKMRGHIASCLGVSVDLVSIKATTSEKLGMIGREEGICAMAVCLLLLTGKNE